MPLLSSADVVEVLIVDHDRYPDKFGEEPGADLARYLARYGVEVNVRTISSKGGDVGTVLLDTTMELSADLLVLGAYSHGRFTEAIFGGRDAPGSARSKNAYTDVAVKPSATSWFVVYQRYAELRR